jgi:hypothetical protein
VRPARPQAGAWRTKQSLLTTNYELKSPSRRADDSRCPVLKFKVNSGPLLF